MKPLTFGIIGLWMGAIMLGACQLTPVGDSTSSVKTRSAERIIPPPGLRQALTPLEGDKLTRARQPLAAILEHLPTPEFAPSEVTWDDHEPPSAPQGQAAVIQEPPLAAQRAYMIGRDAWRRRENFVAIRELQNALRLAPEQPEILRLLGWICTATGNKVRGAYYLKQAASLAPDHLETMFLLARFALEQGRWDDAIAIFGLLTERLEPSASGGTGGTSHWAVAPLIHHYLAVALRHDGYAQAAILQYRIFMEQPRKFMQGSQWSRELRFLDRQQATTWQAIGDLHNQLGAAATALQAYHRAEELGLADQHNLNRRKVYSHLRLGQNEAATQLVINQVSGSRVDASSLSLVGYLAKHNLLGDKQVAKLRETYLRNARPTAMALIIADLLPRPDASAWLMDHLKAKPVDRRVFEKLLAITLESQRDPDVSRSTLVEALGITAQVMTLSPEAAHSVAQTMIRSVGDAGAIVPATENLGKNQPHQDMIGVIRAMALAQTGHFEGAVKTLEQVLDQSPQLHVAVMELAGLLLEQGQVERAGQLLAPLVDSNDVQVIRLYAQVLSATGKVREALTLVQRVLRGGPGDTSLVIQQAHLQELLKDPNAAEQTLLDALNRKPNEEDLYQALFGLYNRMFAASDGRYQRLMRRMLGTIPNSRIARLKRAQWYDATSKPARAEALLTELLEEDPRDILALGQLVALYLRTDRRDLGLDRLEQSLTAHPNDRQLLRLALTVYEAAGDKDKRFGIAERFLLLQGPSVKRTLGLAQLYLGHDQPEQAAAQLLDALKGEKVQRPDILLALLWRTLLPLERTDEAEQHLQAGMKRFPDHAADIGYQWASLVEQLGDKARAQNILLQVLKLDPDHAPANNNLAYAWAVANRNLDEAHAMLQKVVDAEPDNPAYLDSMGWVLYKLSRFDEAVTFLRQARAAVGGEYPVILDHLADALYRLGEHEQAHKTWIKALALFDNDELPPDDPDLQGLDERLRQKIKARGQKQQPAVAPLPDEVDDANAMAL